MSEINNMQKLLKKCLLKTEESIVIISAFVTDYGFEFIEEYLADSVEKKIIIFRGRLNDFKKGSTEFDFTEAVANGWDIYINLDLHIKMYIFDEKELIDGSSNLTWGGLVGNDERNNLKRFTEQDQKQLDKILSSATQVDEENLDRVVEIKDKLDNLDDESSLIELQRKWKGIFFDSKFETELVVKGNKVTRRESLFLTQRANKLKEQVIGSRRSFTDQITARVEIPEDYIIDFSLDTVNYEDFHFKDERYQYLLRSYEINGNLYREIIDYDTLKVTWEQLTENERTELLDKIINAVKELYTQDIMVNLVLDRIYYYDWTKKKIKFIDYTKLKENISRKAVEDRYRDRLTEIFDNREEIDNFELGGQEHAG